VLKAQGIKNGKYVAIKCMKNHFDSLDQVNNLREIQALRRLSPHPGIIKLCEVLYDQPTRRLALVFELMDMNIYELIRGRRQYLQELRIKNYMYQLLKSMDHMHRNGIFHRDIKPENILITDDELKLADFGSCRGIYSKQPYTEYISTRWYRAPECLLTDGFYNYKMDMWGVGCVFFEVLSLYPLFPGTNELDQVTKIHQILGTPPAETLAKLKKHSNSHIDFNFPHKEGQPMAKLIPHCSPECVDVIVRLLAYDPDDRLSARQAVKHAYFKDLRAAELKEKQAAAAAAQGVGGDSELAQDERGHAPASTTQRHTKKALSATVGADGGSSMLPSIEKHGASSRTHKHSKEIPSGPSDVSESHRHDGGAHDGGVPSQQANSHNYGGSAHDHGAQDEGSSGMLPPIGGGGFQAYGGHGGGGVGALKIDSKSLMGAHGKSQTHKAREMRLHMKGASKKSATTRPAVGGVGGSAVQMQSRSCASCGDVLDFGVGNSSQHGSQIGIGHSSQPQIEADGMGMTNLKPSFKKAYQSPYSQRNHGKQKL
jgi:renal tumor antigen